MYITDMHYITALTTIVILKYASGFIFNDFNEGILKYVSNIKYNSSQISEEWIEQPLDHFGQNNQRWKMRYFKNLDLWKANGPVYIFIGGEGEASPVWLTGGFSVIHQLAEETGGAMFLSEHRYYGKSAPVNPVTVPSLQYLSSQQALADLAKLIEFIKSAPQFRSSKVVVVGGSYAGSLAAWARLRYPHLVDAALSSSGPVLAKKDFYEYLENVAYDFNNYGTPGCLQNIQKIFARYAEMLKTPSGIEQLKHEQNICSHTDMSVKENQQLFLTSQQVSFESVAQYGSQSEMKKRCENLRPTDIRSRFFSVLNSCNDYDLKTYASQIRIGPSSYPWTYQVCTEFGYFQTTTSKKQPFGDHATVDFYVKLFCKAVFGDEFDERRLDAGVARTNGLYGGLAPNVTRVVFTHGDMDPWHRLGVLADLSAAARAVLTPGTTHCGILAATQTELAALTKDREYVKSLIKQWIA